MKEEVMQIRRERPDEGPAIRALVRAAFTGGGHEPDIVDRLRAADALTLSLVAIERDEIVGHVAFSPMRIDGCDLGWLGLGPLAVRPDRQRRGIGSALVRQGLAMIGAMGASGCVLLGSPAYYGRFGFAADARLTLPGFPPDHFQCLAFAGHDIPQGEATFHAAFDP
jgi:putative acetyltransferase